VAELAVAGFTSAKACADEQSLVLVQPSRGAYPAPPPAYRGQDLSWLARRLPHAVRTDGTPLVPTLRLHLYTLHNGRFCVGQGMDGLVLTANGRAVQEMSTFSELGRARAAQVTHHLSEADAILDDVFIGFDAAWGNWFHFLCFALGRSALAASLLPSACRIVLPDLASRPATEVRFSAATWQQALASFGLNQATLKLPPGIYRARRLRFLWTEPDAPTDITYLAEFQRIFASIRRGLRGCPDLPRRLLIARDRATDTRLEPNETDLLHRIAAEHGFVQMHFEAMDFHSQVAATFNAEAIIGVHGAGLANLLFGRGNLGVLEVNLSIGGESLPRPWFYLLAMARRQRYLVLNRDVGELNATRLHAAIDALLGLPARVA
jgi:Glycosyltransferase 61